MNQITTQYVTENGACYEQYVITDPAAKTALTITPERGGMVTGFTLDGWGIFRKRPSGPIWSSGGTASGFSTRNAPSGRCRKRRSAQNTLLPS